MRDLVERLIDIVEGAAPDGASEGGFSLNVAKLSPEKAAEYAERIFGRDPEDVIPGFEQNYRVLQRAMKKAKGIPRSKMPVIEPQDIDDFQRDLESGRVDIMAPYLLGKRVVVKGEQKPLPSDAAQVVLGGLLDGASKDDVIRARMMRVPAGELLPIQNQVWLEKLVGNIDKFGVPKQGSPITDKTLIISKDNRIIDGHHRWGQAVLSDPGLKMQVLKVPFDLEELLLIARTYGAAKGRTYKA